MQETWLTGQNFREMAEYLITFFAIYLMALFKFISGPVLGYLAGYSLVEIMFVTVAGMMSSVTVFAYLGEWIKRQWGLRITKKRVVFSRRNRRIVRVWQKFGVIGVAILTPLLLSPIGGTLVLTSFGVERKRIVSYMFVSSVWWSFVFGLFIEKLLEIPILEELLR